MENAQVKWGLKKSPLVIPVSKSQPQKLPYISKSGLRKEKTK